METSNAPNASNMFSSVLKQVAWSNVVPYDNELANSLKVIANIFEIQSSSVLEEYQREFLYGKKMEIWRKGNVKPVEAFIDSDLSQLLWVTTKSKAFLIDLTFSKIERFDYEITQALPNRFYFKVKYFEEEIPFVFWTQKECDGAIHLIEGYIKQCMLTHRYSPMLSKIIKKFKMNLTQQGYNQKHTLSFILEFVKELKLERKDSVIKILQTITNKKPLTKNTEFTMQEVLKLFQLLQCSSKLQPTFQHYSNMSLESELDYLTPILTRQSFVRFLKEIQEEKAEKILFIENNFPEKISFFEFCTHLYSTQSNSATIFNKIDECLPLTDYYCYSSHNTYLTGNQLTSDASINRYLQDLSSGIKCVEIDVWNKGGVPIVTHAFKDKGFCKPIDFQETIKQISHYSSTHPNHLPIILSIENHASNENRVKVHDILLKHFGDRLLLDATKCKKRQDMMRFKKLSELKNKIIIKTDSKLNDVLSCMENIMLRPKGEKSGIRMQLRTERQEQKDEQFERRYKQHMGLVSELGERNRRFDETMPYIQLTMMQPMLKVSGIFKTTWKESSSLGYECNSLTNEEVQKILKKEEERSALLEYTRRSWLRTYPPGSEVGSSNYNIKPMLQAGAQIIALNAQTKDKHAWMAHAYFTGSLEREGHLIGYVEKPKHLRMGVQTTDRAWITYVIKILSDFKIQVKFYGRDSDERENPQENINDNVFRMQYPEEGFIMFKIEEKYKECIALRYVRSGIRVVAGRDEDYYDTGIRMLIKVQITKDSQ